MLLCFFQIDRQMMKKKLGRPLQTDKPLTSAERQKRHREKLAANNKRTVTIKLSDVVADVIDEFRAITGETQSDAIDNILMTWACDAAESMPALREKILERNKLKGNLK